MILIVDETDYKGESVRTMQKIYFNRWLMQFRKEDSIRGKMIRYMISHLDFPVKSHSHFEGHDYFVEKNLNEFAECYLANYDTYRTLPKTSTLANKHKCKIVRLTRYRKNL